MQVLACWSECISPSFQSPPLHLSTITCSPRVALPCAVVPTRVLASSDTPSEKPPCSPHHHCDAPVPCGRLSPQDLSPLVKAALGIKDACIFNPGILHLSEPEGTMLLSFRTYWSAQKGLPCVSSKARAFVILSAPIFARVLLRGVQRVWTRGVDQRCECEVTLNFASRCRQPGDPGHLSGGVAGRALGWR